MLSRPVIPANAGPAQRAQDAPQDAVPKGREQREQSSTTPILCHSSARWNPVALVSAVFFQYQKSLDSDFHQNDKHTAHRAQCKNVVRPRFSFGSCRSHIKNDEHKKTAPEEAVLSAELSAFYKSGMSPTKLKSVKVLESTPSKRIVSPSPRLISVSEPLWLIQPAFAAST